VPDPEPESVKCCPECGCDMTGRDPKGHALDHWPADIPVRDDTAEARRRQKILMEM